MQDASNREPLVIARQGWFYVGGEYDEAAPGHPMHSHMYVQYQIPQERTSPYPVIMVHGGGQSGTNWQGTPDGREGWEQFFLRRGYATYIVDQVARARSAHNAPHLHGPQRPVNRDFAEQRFIAPERYVTWPQARLHDQWPGEGRPGDEIFDQFVATQHPPLADYAMQQHLNGRALVKLIEKIGKSILIVHSQSGAFGWVVADRRPDLLAALVALEPNGPPVRDVENLGPPDWFCDTGRVKVSGLGDVQLTWDPPLRDGESLAFAQDAEPSRLDSPRGWKQAEPARKLPNVAKVKTVMITADASYHAPYDHCTAAFLRQAGVELDHIYLADHGITGTGHMLMIEKTSDAIAGVVHEWLQTNL